MHCCPGIGKMHAISPGGRIPSPIMCGFRKLCCSKHGLRLCEHITCGFWNSCRISMHWQKHRKAGCSSCGKGSAIITVHATFKKQHNCLKHSITAFFRINTRISLLCRASVLTLRVPLLPSVLTGLVLP